MIKINQKYIYSFFFFIITIIFFKTFYQSSTNIIGGGWAFNELFVNYSGGLIRRGLFGEIFLKLNNLYNISPLVFSSVLFSILHSFNIYLYYKILKRFVGLNFFLIFIIFSPALILFPIHENDAFYVKDLLTNLTILIHAYYILENKKNFEFRKYNNFLLLIILPLIFINLFNHENQFFFIPVHFLISIYAYEKFRVQKFNRKYIYYVFVFIPIIILLFNGGSWEKLDAINNSISQFGLKINNQHAGNLNLAIGAFIKWNFFHHGVNEFLNFLICFILTIFIFYLLFGYLIDQNIFKLKNNIKKIYLLFFVPSLALFILALDYGRNINLILTHLLAFYLILDIDEMRFKNFFIKINKNFIFKNSLILFLIFYCFMWYVPLSGGYPGIGSFTPNSSLINNTILFEFREIFMFFFNFIDQNIFTLPKIKIL